MLKCLTRVKKHYISEEDQFIQKLYQKSNRSHNQQKEIAKHEKISAARDQKIKTEKKRLWEKF